MIDGASLRFLGAAGTVTGSKHLLTTVGGRVLLDCGLFQGLKALRLRNWEQPPFTASEITAVVLSHAHVDHSGYLPLLARRGFRGSIHCTPGTRDLLRILLLDAARLQEEEAGFANRHGYSKHRPALPLYTEEDAEAALRLVEAHAYGEAFGVAAGVRAVLRRAGHILGSATVGIDLEGTPPLRLVYSGDLGRWDRPILRNPELVGEADFLLVESTYGDRTHAPDPEAALAAIVKQAAARGGALLIPAFAVGRTQDLMWTLDDLARRGRIPSLPMFVDSPMALDVTRVYGRHPEDQDADARFTTASSPSPAGDAERRQDGSFVKRFTLVRSIAESKALNRSTGPLIIIAGSGMATGGRILHHLRARLPDPRTTVLLAGFQAAGTRGRSLQDGAPTVRMLGENVPVRAQVATLGGLSAHADRNEILRWLRGFERAPRQVYVVHGEPAAAQALATTIGRELGWSATVARDGESVPLA